MAVHRPSVVREIELNSIKNDTRFYLELILQLSSHQSASILIFGLIPYLSLFIVETYKYLQDALPVYASSLSKKHDGVIRSSRMRVKFFDDSKKRVDGMFELLDWIIEFHNEWHINKHKGFLSPLKRILQKDLGIFGYDGHIIGSTHTGLFNLGYEKGDLPTIRKEISAVLGPLSFSFSEEMGQYIGQLSNWPEFAPDNMDVNHFEYNIQDEKLGYRDEKSYKYFASVFNGSEAQELNFTLMLFLATVNFFQHILKQLLVGSPSTLFKLKFMMLYHLASSLRKLQNYYYPKDVLTSRSKKYFQAILRDRDLAQIRTLSKFRNILVHYRIDGVPDEILAPTARLFGLVEYFFDRKTYTEIEDKLDNQIERISILLEEWLDWHIKPSQFSSW